MFAAALTKTSDFHQVKNTTDFFCWDSIDLPHSTIAFVRETFVFLLLERQYVYKKGQIIAVNIQKISQF